MKTSEIVNKVGTAQEAKELIIELQKKMTVLTKKEVEIQRNKKFPKHIAQEFKTLWKKISPCNGQLKFTLEVIVRDKSRFGIYFDNVGFACDVDPIDWDITLIPKGIKLTKQQLDMFKHLVSEGISETNHIYDLRPHGYDIEQQICSFLKKHNLEPTDLQSLVESHNITVD